MDPRIDGREAWWIAIATLLILAISFGAPHIVNVGLKEIAAELGGQRSVPSGANALAWLGTGLGGIAMGLIAERYGIRWTVMGGATMVCVGLLISSGGAAWQLFVGHGLFIGLLGTAGINAPLYVYVTRWFDRRRGTAVALIASGQYLAGAFWPPLYERAIAHVGWRQTMVGFACVIAVLVLPIAAIFLKRPPAVPPPKPNPAGHVEGRVFGLPTGASFTLLCAASFLCCVPMAIPQAHLIAFCGDLGMAASKGAAMLSVLLICAFFARQVWGWVSDRVGGLATLVMSSAAQAVAIAGFMMTTDEAGLFFVSAAFGLGFSGMIPAYMLTARENFPAAQASWRMPTLLLTGTVGMAAGGFSAGWLYDHFGTYLPAFGWGLGANILNFIILASLLMTSWLTLRSRRASAFSGAEAMAMPGPMPASLSAAAVAQPYQPRPYQPPPYQLQRLETPPPPPPFVPGQAQQRSTSTARPPPPAAPAPTASGTPLPPPHIPSAGNRLDQLRAERRALKSQIAAAIITRDEMQPATEADLEAEINDLRRRLDHLMAEVRRTKPDKPRG